MDENQSVLDHAKKRNVSGSRRLGWILVEYIELTDK
eukprot:COSAG02_NODE_19897_length_859_cov_1.505263_1_plen_36_part_00